MKKVLCFLWKIYATLIGYIYISIITVIISFLSILMLIIRFPKAVWALQRFWAWSSFFVLGKIVRIEGRENIEKKKRYLIVSNHASLFDIMAICLIQPDQAAWVAKSSLFKVPIFGQALALGVGIPVDRGNLKKANQAIESSYERAKQQSVAIFPEGTRTKDGYLQPFKRGFIRILKQSDLDVLPVTLNGFYDLRPTSSVQRYINPCGRLEIMIHPSIPNRDLAGLSDSEIIERVKNVIEEDYQIKYS